uniref:Rab GTPase domain-containing protein n=1 Tax=Schistosoma mansoni TaxID=6183 RepID=A0A3Q0KDD7_SCHMA
MGASIGKVLNYLYIVDHGEATTDSNLKKAKITCMLSSTQKPPKPNPHWKHLELQKPGEELRISNLKAGAKFIHESRCSRENIAVIIEPNNHESAAFIITYFTILSGLPVALTRKAVMKCREKLDITNEYDPLIESMQKSTTPKELRDELFKGTSGYTEDRLIEDLRKIYQLAELDPPSSSEIFLETRRESIKLGSPTTNSSSNQLFKRLSIDINKKESINEKNISSPNLNDKTSELVVNESDHDIKQDPSTTISHHNYHSTDHNNSILNDMKHDLHQVDQINNNNSKLQNGTVPTSYNYNKEIGGTKSPNQLHNTDMNTTHNNNNNNNHEIDNYNNINKLKSSKITISYAITHESTEADAVDEYLKNTSADERDRLRKHVIITHAYSKIDDHIDQI